LNEEKLGWIVKFLWKFEEITRFDGFFTGEKGVNRVAIEGGISVNLERMC
jgi:hypothetical protein